MSSLATARLGAFELSAVLGQGSMGDVFLGHHVLLGLPAAIKVLNGNAPARIAAFETEVSTLASLDHPGIVEVYDHGYTPAHGPALDAFALVPGAPWFAMELVDGGTLRAHPVHAWDGLRAVLTQLLDALGHCHARGIVHCDLKPSNVLVGRSGPETRYKLSDFGVLALDPSIRPDTQPQTVAGTPRYMAPEQLRDQWRDLGPATDLYALAGIAWHLATGAAPFPQRGLDALVRAHLAEPPPAFAPRFPVPDGLEGWLRRCLAKPASARFPSVAEARRALEGLLGSLDAPSDVIDLRWLDVAAEESGLSGIGIGLLGLREVPLCGRLAERAILGDALGEVCDTPASAGAVRVVVLNARPGLGASRLAEWSAARAHELGLARVLRATASAAGAPGIDGLPAMIARTARSHGLPRGEVAARLDQLLPEGHTVPIARLVEWLAETDAGPAAAGEPSAWQGPRSRHGMPAVAASPGPGARARVRVRETVKETVSERALDPEPSTTSGVVRFANERAQLALVYEFLAALSEAHPLLLWLDDAHCDPFALAFVRHALTVADAEAAGPRLRALFVCTCDASDETGSAQVPLAHARRVRRARTEAEALRHTEGVAWRALEPLPDTDQRALVASRLRMVPDLVERIVDGTGGVPLFAVLLTDAWAARGLLEMTPDGIALRADASAEIPSNVAALWRDQLARALDAWSIADGRGPLEVAAALGGHPVWGEWRAACEAAGYRATDAVLAALERSRLARRDGADGWQIAHPTLTAIAARDARRAGRWAAAHRACATILGAQGLPSHAVLLAHGLDARALSLQAARIGHHLDLAGDAEAAVAALLMGAEAARRSGDYEGALELLDRRQERLPTRSDGALDAARAAGLLLRARIAAARSELDEAAAWVARVGAGTEPALAPWWRALADFVGGMVAFKRGDHDGCLGLLEAASDGFGAVGDLASQAEAMLISAKPLQVADAARALPRLEAAREAARRSGDAFHFARATLSLGEHHVRHGDRAQGRRHLERALELFQDLGNAERVAATLNDLGEVARFDGDLATAEEHYRKAEQALGAVGSRDRLLPRLNRALVLLARDRFGEAAAVARSVAEGFDALGRPSYAQVAWLVVAAASGAQGEWDAAADGLEAHRVRAARSRVCDVDVATPAERLGRAALTAGELRIAEVALRIAEAQWGQLERPASRAAVAALLGSL